MKFNFPTLVLALMATEAAASVTPQVHGRAQAKAVSRRLDGRLQQVGQLVSRHSSGQGFRVFRENSDDDDDKDKDEDEDEDKASGEDEDADEDSESDSDSAATSSSTSSGSASATGSSGASAVTATSSPKTTGSSSSGSSSSGGSLPQSSGTSVLSAVQTIAAGESFDGGMVMFDRGVDCTGQAEGGDSDAVFEIEEGGSLSNVIIGPNQIEGVHCFGACTLTNVWWSAVCEDAFTVKEQDAGATTTISGGGAFGAEDKVIQHNGAGTIAIEDFTVSDFGKLYRSCGNCDTMYERHVTITGVTASGGKLLAGVNGNYGDTATITSTTATDMDGICANFEGNDTGDEPTETSEGADGTTCIYDEADFA